MHEWTKVTEKLPEERKWVIVCGDFPREIPVARLIGKKFFDFFYYELPFVKYWMDFPQIVDNHDV